MITGKGVWDKWGLDDGMLLFGAYWSFVIAEVRKHLFCELLVAGTRNSQPGVGFCMFLSCS